MRAADGFRGCPGSVRKPNLHFLRCAQRTVFADVPVRLGNRTYRAGWTSRVTFFKIETYGSVRKPNLPGLEDPEMDTYECTAKPLLPILSPDQLFKLLIEITHLRAVLIMCPAEFLQYIHHRQCFFTVFCALAVHG